MHDAKLARVAVPLQPHHIPQGPLTSRASRAVTAGHGSPISLSPLCLSSVTAWHGMVLAIKVQELGDFFSENSSSFIVHCCTSHLRWRNVAIARATPVFVRCVLLALRDYLIMAPLTAQLLPRQQFTDRLPSYIQITSDVSSPEEETHSVVVFCIVLPCIATTLTILRLYTRIFLTRGLGLDDGESHPSSSSITLTAPSFSHRIAGELSCLVSSSASC